MCRVYSPLKVGNCSDNATFRRRQILYSLCTGKCMSCLRQYIQIVSRRRSNGSWFVCPSNVQYHFMNLCSAWLLRWTERWQREVGTRRWILSTPLRKAEGCNQCSLLAISGNIFPYGACSRSHKILDTKFVYAFFVFRHRFVWPRAVHRHSFLLITLAHRCFLSGLYIWHALLNWRNIDILYVSVLKVSKYCY
jgi:hypothetical protein